MRFALTLGLLVSLTAVPALAEAAPRRYYRSYPERRELYYPRHDGLMLRLALGLGGVAADDELNDVTLSGGAALFSLDLGGAVAPNLALHGRLSVNSMFEPSVSSDGEDFGDLEDTSLTFSLLGVGLTYYLPSNFYLTGVLGLSRATFEFDGDEYDSLNGGGFIGDVGYEWPLGRDWGIGVAGRLELHSVRGDDETLSMASLGLLVSLTYF
jgi:hypothetical protein